MILEKRLVKLNYFVIKKRLHSLNFFNQEIINQKNIKPRHNML